MPVIVTEQRYGILAARFAEIALGARLEQLGVARKSYYGIVILIQTYAARYCQLAAGIFSEGVYRSFCGTDYVVP